MVKDEKKKNSLTSTGQFGWHNGNNPHENQINEQLNAENMNHF